MILAAGRGERMRPLTDRVPKPMLIAGGKPLIVWMIEALRRAGITDIVVNHAHLGHLIESGLGDGKAFGVELRYSRETEALETAGGIRKALPLLGGDPFLVVNGDVYSDYDLTLLADAALTLQRGGALAQLVMVENPPHHPAGDFSLSGDVLRPADGPTFTFSGMGAYHPAIFEPVVAGEKARLAPLLKQPMSEGRVKGVLHGGYWTDVGTPERLSELNDRLSADRLSRKAPGYL